MPVYTQSVAAESRVLGSEQNLKFNRSRSVFRLSNTFIPDINILSTTTFEFRNHKYSGFRFAHETQNTQDSGSLRLMSFSSALLDGITLITIDTSSITVSTPLSILPPVQPNHPATKLYVDSKPLDTLAPPTSDVNLNAKKMINLAAPISSADAATKGYVDSHPVSTFSVPINHCDWNFYRIYNLGDPILSAHAATKGYVDSHPALSTTGVIPGSYMNPTLTINEYGRITSAVNGFNVMDIKLTGAVTGSMGVVGISSSGDFIYGINTVLSEYVATKTYLDSKPLNTFSMPTGDLNLNSKRITSLSSPILSTDAATKGYVDSHPVSAFGVPINDCDWNFRRIYNLGGPIFSADAATKGYVDSVVPPGCMVMWCGNYSSAPSGWLLCDGSAISRSTYSALFNAIGTTWGNGDGSSTFNLPDGRGLFPRGVSRSSGNDPDVWSRNNSRGGSSGNNVGSYQEDTFGQHAHSGSTSLGGTHNHDSRGYYSAVTDITGFSFVSRKVRARYDITDDPRDSGPSTPLFSSGDHQHDFSTSYSGGSETRPKNFYVNFIIKY